MSSHQPPYPYPDPNQMYYPVTRRSHSQERSWTQTIPALDQSGFTQSHQSVDDVGSLLDAQEAQDTFHQPHPSYPLQVSSLQGLSLVDDVTDNNDGFGLENLPFPFDHRQYPYVPYEPNHDFPGQVVLHSAPTSGHLAPPINPFYTLNFQIPQTSQGPPSTVYTPSPSSSTLHLSPDRDGPVYRPDAVSMHPVTPSPSSSTQHLSPDRDGTMYRLDAVTVHAVPGSRTPDGVNTTDAIGHSHPSPVATSPSKQKFSPGPSRPIPSSPERKRLLSLSTEGESSTGRRVLPRSRDAWSVHSTSPDSHRSHPPGRGPLIPQERYTTNTVSIFSSAEHHPLITFNLDGPHEVGVPIIDILEKARTFDRISDRTHAFSHMGKQTFTLRLQWPGYPPWSKTIAALNWKKERTAITREKLAEAVAIAVRNLVDKKRNEQCDAQYAEWNLGPDGIRLEQLCLVALHHVSKGSWQPELCLLEPRHRSS